MRNVCCDCRFGKEKSGGVYCVKYGCVIWQAKVFCVGLERGTNEQVSQSENGDRRDHV